MNFLILNRMYKIHFFVNQRSFSIFYVSKSLHGFNFYGSRNNFYIKLIHLYVNYFDICNDGVIV